MNFQTYEEAITEHAGLIKKIARKYLGYDLRSIEDCLQEVHIKIFKYYKNYEKNENYFHGGRMNVGFIVNRTREAALSILRKKSRTKEIPVEDIEKEYFRNQSTSNVINIKNIEQKVFINQMERFLSNLEKLIWCWKFIEGLTFEEIAEALDSSKANVHSMWTKSIKKIKKLLEDKSPIRQNKSFAV